MNITYIYLLENCYGDPNKVYIGKTIVPKYRFNNHKRKFGNKINFTIIDQIDSLSYKDWKPLESYWIEQMKVWEFRVMNSNKGGGGPEKHSNLTKHNISKSLKGRKNIWNKDKELSSDTKSKISKALKGRKVTWICNKLLGYKYTDNQRQNLIKGKQKCFEQYDLQGNFIKEWISTQSDIARFFNKDVGSLSAHVTGKQKTAFGYIWKIKKNW